MEEVTVAAGESHLFGERQENMGTWSAVRKIASIKYIDIDSIRNIFTFFKNIFSRKYSNIFLQS